MPSLNYPNLFHYSCRMNPLPRLSPRLSVIYELIEKLQQQYPYPCIWDCCCDHGYLGIKILANELCEKIIFVDQLTHLIEQLSGKLAESEGRHELITADAGELSFKAGQRHLVILAGVGGDTSVEIVEAIEDRHPAVQIDYIFCPSTSQKALREYLANNNFQQAYEGLVCDNKRYYEILYVKGKAVANKQARISLSCTLWNKDNPDHQRYLKKINTPRGSKKTRR